ncbi:hypothetical protein OAO01_03650 [Oligoflexia bacterium]|nr:hypothetical protein [Oligoflexia bacterium]
MEPDYQYVVGWGTLMFINAGLAQSKKRSGLAWWFLSLFLGPFATFLIVCLPPLSVDEPPQEQSKLQELSGQ